jgi:hypothetical protein
VILSGFILLRGRNDRGAHSQDRQYKEKNGEPDRDNEDGFFNTSSGGKGTTGITSGQATKSDTLVLHDHADDQRDRSYNQGDVKKLRNVSQDIPPRIIKQSDYTFQG